jgi:hypothetical protein
MTNREWLENLPKDRQNFLKGHINMAPITRLPCPSKVYKNLFRSRTTSLLCSGITCHDCKQVWLDRECLWPELK